MRLGSGSGSGPGRGVAWAGAREVYRDTARPVRVCVESAVLVSLRMSIMWSLDVLLTTTFGRAVDCFEQELESRWDTSCPV